MEEHEDIFEEMAGKSEQLSDFIHLNYLKIERIKVRKIAEYEIFGPVKTFILRLLGLEPEKLSHYCLEMWVLNPEVVRPNMILVDENQVKWYVTAVDDDCVEAHNVELIQGELKIPGKDMVIGGIVFCTN